MVSATALNTLPHDQLASAYSQEIHELCRYRCLALCFLPFDPPVSRLMGALGMECEHRLCSLQEMAEQMELVLAPTINPLSEMPSSVKNGRHFFVLNEYMGKRLIIEAEQAAKASRMFFSRLYNLNATPELRQLLISFVAQKKSEYQVLKECREQWRINLSDFDFAS